MFKARQNVGKYRIEGRLAEGGFAAVYRATDTIEGVRVALKVPYAHLLTKEVLDAFRHEVRLAARLDHPNILPLKNASFIDGHFVIVSALGEQTLDDRMQSRMALRTALDLAEQMLAAVAYAHEHRIIHCDIKPDNFVLFSGNRLRLTDFGIAKVARHTVRASGSGTVGFVAPEQAMGKPSLRSDVFSLGLILYRMFAGALPEWPFEWPPPGFKRLRERVRPELIELIRRAMEIDPRRRYESAVQTLAAFRRIKSRALHPAARRRRTGGNGSTRDWRTVRWQQFQRQYGKLLQAHAHCSRCQGPVSEAMTACPWCGKSRLVHEGGTKFPAQCPRCQRGMKLDWRYCPWCYGPGFEPISNRHYSDVRYEGRCGNARCLRKVLMPMMRYCPWCHRKVRRKWKIPGSDECCSGCGHGVLSTYWSWCPWCGKAIERGAKP